MRRIADHCALELGSSEFELTRLLEAAAAVGIGREALVRDLEETVVERLSMWLIGIVDDSFASEFHQALVNSGSESVIERVEGARHMNVRQPEWVGDLIVVWLER